MKQARTISVIGDKGERISIHLSMDKRVNFDQEKVQTEFEEMVDEAHGILSSRYHVFAIKVR